MKQRIPDGIQIFLLLVFIFAALTLLGPVISGLFLSFMDLPDVESIDASQPRIGYVLVFSGMIALFLMAFLLFFRVTGERWRSVIRYRKFRWVFFGLTLLVLAGGWIVAEGLYILNHLIIEQFPRAGYLEAEQALNEQLQAWFTPEKKHLLPLALLIFAALPAFVEELIFRGILMSKLMKVSGNVHFGVIVSAMLFAAMHMQPWNLLPMIGLGAVLGYLYYYTKDIRYNMLMHFLYNGIQIVLMFYLPQWVV